MSDCLLSLLIQEHIWLKSFVRVFNLLMRGQSEAAKSLGMTTSQTLISVIFPQAIKNTFPSIGNQLIVNIKDSSMLNVISVTELYFQTTSVARIKYEIY